ncbi:MAG: ABC transporter substrate-binding protein [candidate division WOR-3 bacterium]|nr:ABC transporter substrate-binding protein [candidate division WOR-3 bacterium]
MVIKTQIKKIFFCFIILGTVLCTQEKKCTVYFWHVMGGPIGKRLEQMIQEFNQQHPEGVIKSVQMGSYDALAQKLMGAIASNTPPTISQMYESWTDQFLKAGCLEPLQNFINSDSLFNIADFYPVFIEDNTFDSIIVTLPFNKSLPVFYYNATLFDSAGIAEFPKDWDEFRRVCERLKNYNIWPTSWPIDVWYFSSMLYQEGGELFDEQTKRPLFNSEAGKKVLEYLVNLIKDSLFYLNPGFQRQDEFLSRNVATIPASIVSWAFLKGRHKFNMRVAPFPMGKKKSIVIAGTNVGMFKRATLEQKQLAWKFIRWFLEPEQQVRWTIYSYYLPTRRSATELPEFKKFLSENPDYSKVIAQLDYARTEPRTKEWFTGRIYLNEALEEAMRLERTPDQALENAEKRFMVDLE